MMGRDKIVRDPFTGEPLRFKYIDLEPRTGIWNPSEKFLKELEITKAKLEIKPRKFDVMREQDNSVGAI